MISPYGCPDWESTPYRWGNFPIRWGKITLVDANSCFSKSLNVSGAGTGNVMRKNMLYMSLGNGMRCDDWQNGTIFEKNVS